MPTGFSKAWRLAGKGTTGRCHGFRLRFTCNDRGEIIGFRLTGANVDDRAPKVWNVPAKEPYGRLFADREGYISPRLFADLFEDGIHLATGIRADMKNRLMAFFKVIPNSRIYELPSGVPRIQVHAGEHVGICVFYAVNSLLNV